MHYCKYKRSCIKIRHVCTHLRAAILKYSKSIDRDMFRLFSKNTASQILQIDGHWEIGLRLHPTQIKTRGFTNLDTRKPRRSPFHTNKQHIPGSHNSTHHQLPQTCLVPHKVKLSRCELVRRFWNKLIYAARSNEWKTSRGHKTGTKNRQDGVEVASPITHRESFLRLPPPLPQPLQLPATDKQVSFTNSKINPLLHVLSLLHY